MKVQALGITRDAPWPPPGAGKGPCDARSSGGKHRRRARYSSPRALQASWRASAPMRGARGMSRMTTMGAGAMDGWVLMGWERGRRRDGPGADVRAVSGSITAAVAVGVPLEVEAPEKRACVDGNDSIRVQRVIGTASFQGPGVGGSPAAKAASPIASTRVLHRTCPAASVQSSPSRFRAPIPMVRMPMRGVWIRGRRPS